MNKAITINRLSLPLIIVLAVFTLSSSSDNTEANVSFQDYCWPILGETDTTFIYQYQMKSVEYDTSSNRYFEIEAHNDGSTRFFNYTVYDKNFRPESHYKYVLDHKGIRLTEIEANDSESHLCSGTVQHQRMFEWDLKRGEKHTCLMGFFNLLGDSTKSTISNTSEYEGFGKKVVFDGYKLGTIRFSRFIHSDNKNSSNVSEGVSCYAKGIGYYRSHIIYNDMMEFDETLTDILTVAEWDKLRQGK